MNNKIKCIFITVLIPLAGCAYKGQVASVSGASEIMPSRQIKFSADVRIDPEISNLNPRVNTGFVCSGHKYNINAGPAISESIMKTLEGGFLSVSKIDTQQQRPGTYFLDFSLSEFAPRLRFNPGFWVATPEGNAELSLRVRATKPDGTLAYQGTVSGDARYEDNAGGCSDGMPVVEQATKKAIQEAMEDLAQKIFNSKVLTEK